VYAICSTEADLHFHEFFRFADISVLPERTCICVISSSVVFGIVDGLITRVITLPLSDGFYIDEVCMFYSQDSIRSFCPFCCEESSVSQTYYTQSLHSNKSHAVQVIFIAQIM